MKTATGVAIAWLAGSLLVCGGSGAAQSPPSADTKPPQGEPPPIPQDREVVITIAANNQLTARSQDAVIHVGRPLVFSVRGLREGHSLEIDFEVYHSKYKNEEKDVKGPFEWRRHPANPVRGRFLLSDKNTRVETGNSDTPGYFKYHVVLRDANNKDLALLDPGVVVKNEI
jgi:hypothetical protein